jgi:DNA invertase Pin-like site-specific DNA recombinase
MTIAGRTYGYTRASMIEEVESPEAQAEIIATYCRRIGRRLDDVFLDDAPSCGLPLAEREGGKALLRGLRKGDHIVAARMGGMFRSFIEFGKTLDAWARLGVVRHLCDVPAGPLDPEDPLTRHLIDLLVLFNASRSRTIAARCRAVSDRLKAEGRRNSRFAPYGFRWEECGGLSYQVPDPARRRSARATGRSPSGSRSICCPCGAGARTSSARRCSTPGASSTTASGSSGTS